MRRTFTFYILIFLIFNVFIFGSNDYKMPPKAIADIVDAPATPEAILLSINDVKKKYEK